MAKHTKRTWLEIYKGIRKPPTPPGQVIQPKDREIEAGVAEDEMLNLEEDEARCVFCGEVRSFEEFHDGLRCVFCAEEQDGAS